MTKYTGPIEEVEIVEKVRMTELQAQEFESFKTLRSSLEEWARDKQDPNAPYSIIHELTFDEMARAYLIGYEIEPEQPKFQPGDKLYSPIIGILNVISCSGSIVSVKEFSYPLPADEYRHATPEEIYWRETLGRDSVKDFHIGDVYIDRECRAEVLEKERHLQLAQIWYADEDFRGLYPNECFKPFPKESTNAHHR